ncbi:phosphate/phosphite/phosphonate ABC transporter substrate-binding protein [Leucobacter sp. CSA2]|uniref:Phosphate/phosphite/phosphonate ABC transporter substrate-binding protein n=1 Tax=Leucobacter edaphi TaxID=2796472 RepID=A0A934QER5_9MICO|nr:phosphate/phosphite/phosphonate ABC transporter substrate-binding protein [Leucobacter edaphi]MBK0422716.1 phosphate/phosphite/phosphonate ABC transporter substrate-binding protein [Leucobacter edaphi]
MRRHILPVVAALGIAAIALVGCSSAEGDTAAAKQPKDPNAPITMAAVPIGEDPTAESPYDVIAELFQKETGRKLEITEVPDYLSVVEAIRADHVDIGIMSGFPSALAVGTGKVDALMSFGGDGKPVSTCVVLKDSPVQKLEDLRGKTVAFADQASSSGFFMPVYMLHEVGLENNKDYKSIFAGGHEGSFAALKQGQVDAACTAVMLTQLGEPMFPFKDGEWRAVGESPAMDVSTAVLGRQSLDEDTRKQVDEGFRKVLVKENAKRLGAFGPMASAQATSNPDPKIFDQFAEIADVAGVKLKDMK